MTHLRPKPDIPKWLSMINIRMYLLVSFEIFTRFVYLLENLVLDYRNERLSILLVAFRKKQPNKSSLYFKLECEFFKWLQKSMGHIHSGVWVCDITSLVADCDPKQRISINLLEINLNRSCGSIHYLDVPWIGLLFW